jgi:hypothetical protein
VASLVWRFADDMAQKIESDHLLTASVDVAESGFSGLQRAEL